MHTMPQTVALANASQRLVTVHVPIVAVNQYEGKGVVGNLTLRLIPGNSNVLIDTNPFVDTGLQYSANLAVTVAKLKTKNYAPNYDFILSYEVPAQVVGGESAGAATTIATIAALEGKRIKQGVLITGTINQDGSIGRVGGILEKAKAAAESGYKLFLVPKGQSTITYYERVIEPHSFGFGFVLYNNRYVPKTIDLAEVAKEEWGLEIKEVGTIEEALAYMVE
ncbi:hypothetical protein KY318_03090 [Candidatus Woesearchaeota archaeon]|nr:hypothetical protein [Candidatus Woesearchaeota archaeon]